MRTLFTDCPPRHFCDAVSDCDCGCTFARAVPTPDHFVPLLYLAGLAAAEDTRPEPIVRGYSMGSISMTCHALGVNLPVDTEAEDAATLPRDVPADQTNI